MSTTNTTTTEQEGTIMTTTDESRLEWETSPEAYEAEKETSPEAYEAKKTQIIQYLKDNDRRDGGSLDIFIHAACMNMQFARLDNVCVQLMRENAELRAQLRDLAERLMWRAP